VIYEIAADLTALVHLCFLAFVISGALLGRRSRFWKWVHLTCMAYGVFIEIFYWYCPLTYLEQYLRRKAGKGVYQEAFIAHYVNKFIYLDVPQWWLILAAVVIFVLNLSLYLSSSHRAKGSSAGGKIPPGAAGATLPS